MIYVMARQNLERVAAWEASRDSVREWFVENFYGRAPIGRPDDIVFGEREITFADGRIVMHLQVKLPAEASPEHPVPVFVLGDHARLRSGHFYPGVPEDEITARGYAFVRYDFNEVAPDRNVYEERRIEGVFKEYGGWDNPDGWGRIGAWAWGFSRVLDWIETRPELDAAHVAVVGHSRGGKTALWAAACDSRIALAVSNGSGTGGAHLNSIVTPGSEQVIAFERVGSWNFFCPNFLKLHGHETELEHDADDLIRLIAPRLVYVASGAEDTGAGPQGEFEAARRAGELWEAYGLKGLSLDTYPPPGTIDHGGYIGYFQRPGGHILASDSWMRFLDFTDAHGWRRR
jgi:hypothetical protein